MTTYTTLSIPGYEKVIEVIDHATSLHCIIAMHNTKLGPALGGTRLYPYASREAALNDVLRLSEGMTLKASLAQLGLGGGKAVIIASPEEKNEALLTSYAKVIHSLNGEYITAEDVGTTTGDIAIMRRITPYVVGLPIEFGSGDPSPFTARGVIRSMQAVGQLLWNDTSLKGKTVAIQGIGKVGHGVAEFLFWMGAKLILSDVREKDVQILAKQLAAEVVAPDAIFDVECDIFCPSALGGILNPSTIPHLRCSAIVGSANNQLSDPSQAYELKKRGILYTPDFLVNSGGLINASHELAPGGYNAADSRAQVDRIFDVLLGVLEEAERQDKTSAEVAVARAQYNLENKVGKRTTPVFFHS